MKKANDNWQSDAPIFFLIFLHKEWQIALFQLNSTALWEKMLFNSVSRSQISSSLWDSPLLWFFLIVSNMLFLMITWLGNLHVDFSFKNKNTKTQPIIYQILKARFWYPYSPWVHWWLRYYSESSVLFILWIRASESGPY